ncbi:MAG TPA: ribosome small subunit-dependent GTPase A [Planctomycetota bacterium]|nr:ribosome small subunit-dependent GTPase A [Planctomycetota bacterium]
MIGRVQKIAGNDYAVSAGGALYHCRFRGRLKKDARAEGKLAAVGDEVEFVPTGAGEGVIESVLPRRTKLSRADVHRPRREQVIVANVDTLFVVQAARDPDFNDLVADQCTVMAAANGLPCVLVVNKCDLGEPDLSAYEKAGYRTVRTSVRDGRGLDELRQLLRGRVSVFLGPSGVGKSSLLNALEPGLNLKVGEVSRRGEGRHTTTWVELLPVAGGWAADTPGLEFFTLWGVTPENLKDHFLDFAELAARCRFRDCSHTIEAGCAVREGAVPSRYRNYLALREKLRTRRAVFE